ncbi:MAG: NUDIX domain-containing protein [Bacteroidota bacterium]
MKIFALNLSISFASHNSKRSYEFEPISFEELMAHLFKGLEFPDQQFYVLAENNEQFQQEIFDLQANELWRELDLNVEFVFPSEEQIQKFLADFRERFRETDAAGGIVTNEKDEFLMIYNRKRWTLPKGGVEWGESIEEAALREVKEETGIEEVKMHEKLGETYHTFRRRGKWNLKTTHWYKMSGKADAELNPQAEEDIEDVKWMSREEWLKESKTSYPLVRQVMEQEFFRTQTN